MLKYLRARLDKRLIVELSVALVLIFVVVFSAHAEIGSEFKVVYSLDHRDTDQEIVKLVNNANHYVYFAIYYFSKENIAEALIRAKQRGLDVRGITDAAASLDANRQVVAELRAAGVPLETQKHLDGIMHMKALVTDKAYASGSFNWTGAATEANDEVLEIGTNASVRDQYLSIIKKVLLKNQ
jgi:phosphatidylserine/phosphatidylglycerophosphate/cardiolipin synthase-like enzyme